MKRLWCFMWCFKGLGVLGFRFESVVRLGFWGFRPFRVWGLRCLGFERVLGLEFLVFRVVQAFRV